MNRVDMSVGTEVCTGVGVQVGTFTCNSYLFFEDSKTKQSQPPFSKGGAVYPN